LNDLKFPLQIKRYACMNLRRIVDNCPNLHCQCRWIVSIQRTTVCARQSSGRRRNGGGSLAAARARTVPEYGRG
jgi:hypothetical protein